MSGASLTLVVLRTRDLDAARRFYEALSIAFAAEKHGGGPEHFAGNAGGVLMELYPLATGAADTTTRLGFAVPDIDAAVRAVEAAGAAVVRGPEDSPWGRRAVVVDPDGRKVELTQA